MNNWDTNIENEDLEFESASWRWMDDEIVCVDSENDEFIPQQE